MLKNYAESVVQMAVRHKSSLSPPPSPAAAAAAAAANVNIIRSQLNKNNNNNNNNTNTQIMILPKVHNDTSPHEGALIFTFLLSMRNTIFAHLSMSHIIFIYIFFLASSCV